MSLNPTGYFTRFVQNSIARPPVSWCLAEQGRFRLTRTLIERQIRIVFAPTAPEVRGDRHQAVTWRQRPSVAAAPGGEHLQTSLPTSSVDEAPARPIASKTTTREAASAFAPL